MGWKNFEYLEARHVFTILVAWLIMMDGLINKWLIHYFIATQHHSAIVDIAVLHPVSGYHYTLVYFFKTVGVILISIACYEILS